MESFIIHMVLTLLAQLVKNPSHAAQLKDSMLEVKDAIEQVYG